MTRSYSEKTKAAGIFMDLLQSITVRGWVGCGPAVKNNDSLIYVSFHIHPNDADHIYELMSSALGIDFRGIKWIIKRMQSNRFFICPEQIDTRGSELGNFDAAVNEVMKDNPDFAQVAAQSFIEACDEIYRQFQTSGRKKFEFFD
jgi:hypothetical protein